MKMLRSFASSLASVVLIVTLLTGQCWCCSATTERSSDAAPCCNPDGHCKGSGSTHPSACQKPQEVGTAILQQSTPLSLGTDYTNLSAPPVLVTDQATVVPAGDHFFPLDIYLLHSALLI